METMEDILKEISIVTAKYPDQGIYDIYRMRCQDRLYTDSETIVPPKIERVRVTLKDLAIRINSASMNTRRSLGRIYELSKECMKTSDPYKLGNALYKIFNETRPFVKGEESEVGDEDNN